MKSKLDHPMGHVLTLEVTWLRHGSASGTHHTSSIIISATVKKKKKCHKLSQRHRINNFTNKRDIEETQREVCSERNLNM